MRSEQLVDITAVEIIGDHQLRLTFADGYSEDRQHLVAAG
jgi:hypothetical protein